MLRSIQRRFMVRRNNTAKLRAAVAEALDGRVLLASTISISSSSLVEGNGGQASMNFVVSRTGDLSTAVSFAYATADGSAIAGVDYVSQSGVGTIPVGQATTLIGVPVIGDNLDEQDETFFVNLTSITNVAGPAVSFTGRQDNAAGASPVGAVVADFNLDGRPDTAAANRDAGTIGVYVNATTPELSINFSAAQFFSAGSSPHGIVAADFNADGRADLAVTNGTGTNTVSVLLNTTTPGSTTITFAARQFFTAAASPIAIAVGDINGDGRADIAVGNYDAASVSVFLNTTAPGAAVASLASRQDFPIGLNPDFAGLDVGDLNGDGRADIAVTNSGSSSFSVLRNTTAPGAATSSFANHQPFATGSGPRGIALGDANGDGRLDVAVATGSLGAVSVFLNTTASGSVVYSFAPRLDAPAAAQYGLTWADMNGDARADLVVASNSTGAVLTIANRTVPGSSTPVFDPAVSAAAGAGTFDVVVADFNSDGRPDAFSANILATNVTALGNSTVLGASNIMPAFPQSSFPTGAFPHTAAHGDINNDGRPDLIAANQSSFSVSVLLNTTAAGAATASYAAKQDFAVQSFPDWVSVVDLNQDGRLDLAVANGLSSSISVLLNTTALGSSTVTFGARQDFVVGARPRSVVAVDLNGDGRRDLAVANVDSDTLSIFFNQTAPAAGAVNFQARQDVVVADGPTALAVADYNRDGRPDLAVANANANTASVLLNTTGLGTTVASFAARQDFAVDSGPRGIGAADINGDGRVDLIVANSASELGTTVSTLLNITAAGAPAPAFATKQTTIVGTGPIAVATGDINGDGRQDVAIANFGSNNVSVMLNQTAFGSSTVSYLVDNFATGTNSIFVAVGDVNGDGRADLSSANYGADSASVLINRPFTIAQNLAIGTIIDNDSAPLVSFSPIASAPLSVRWQPVPITPAAIANDPSLADRRTFDLIVTTSTDWISAGVQVTLPAGATFYNNALGGNTAPNPAFVAANPALAFDTYVTGPGGVGTPPFVLGGFPTAQSASFGPTVFSASWGDLITSPAGEYQVARLTFSASALSGTDLVFNTSRTSQTDPQAVDTIISVPEIVQAYSINESSGAVNVPVFLASGAGEDLTLSASVVGGTANNGNDYSGPPPIVIPSGATGGNFPLTIFNDVIDEPNETIELRLNDPANSAAAGTLIAYITIVDNDPTPTVQFAAATSSSNEASGAINVSVTLSGPSSQTITVPLSVSVLSTAVSPDDYSISAGPLIFAPGETSASVVVTMVDDNLDEPDETVNIALVAPTNAVLGATSSHIFTIADNDPTPTVRFTASSASAGEESGTYVVSLELSAASGRDVTVPINLGAGTASFPTDFNYAPTFVSIPAGGTSGSTTITIVNDLAVESNETAVLQFGTPTNATAAVPSQFTLTIVDNDIPPVVQESAFLYQTAPHRLTFRFSANVSASLSTADLVLQNLTGGTVVPAASMQVTYAAATNTATFTFPGVPQGVLTDGNYRARLVASGITDTAGTPLAADVLFDFFHFTGDANHDRAVDIGDFSALATNFNLPGNFVQGDFNYSGVTDLSDFSILAIRFNSFLPAPADLPRQTSSASIVAGGLNDSIFSARLIGELEELLS